MSLIKMLRLRIGSALLLAGALGACAADGTTGVYSVGVGYGSGGYYPGGYGPRGYGYAEPYLYGYPTYEDYAGSYYGSVLFGGRWFSGPLRYRQTARGREYWLRDGWRRPERERADDNNGGWRDRAGRPENATRPDGRGWRGRDGRADVPGGTPVVDRPRRDGGEGRNGNAGGAGGRGDNAPVANRPARPAPAAGGQASGGEDRSQLHPRLRNLGR